MFFIASRLQREIRSIQLYAAALANIFIYLFYLFFNQLCPQHFLKTFLLLFYLFFIYLFYCIACLPLIILI